MRDKPLVEPVFLMCSERSGSNLIARIFGSHPEFFAPSPAHLFRVFSELDPEADLRDALLRMFDAKLGIWKLDDWPRQKQLDLFENCDTTSGMIAALLHAEGALRGRNTLFLKENSSHSFLPFMESVAAGPRYVLMVRDPRDMAASWVEAPTLRGGVVRAARRWLSDVKGALQAENEGRKIVKLTYEALVSQPEKTLRRVCDELGITFSPVMLEHVSNAEGVQQDAGRTALWKNLSRGIMSDNFNKFQGKLSDDDVAFIETLCGPQMMRFGYTSARAPDLPAYGSHDSFEQLEAALAAQEPWEKPAYGNLPADERVRLENWSTLQQELMLRYGTPV